MRVPLQYAILPASVAPMLRIALSSIGEPEEIGFLFVQDTITGERFTQIGDARHVRTLADAGVIGLPGGVEILGSGLPLERRGWPEDWKLADFEV